MGNYKGKRNRSINWDWWFDLHIVFIYAETLEDI